MQCPMRNLCYRLLAGPAHVTESFNVKDVSEEGVVQARTVFAVQGRSQLQAAIRKQKRSLVAGFEEPFLCSAT